ncbi:hypothetical protein ACEPAG_4802 [Sanghuangporus baumii]
MVTSVQSALVGVCSVLVGGYYAGLLKIPGHCIPPDVDEVARWECHPFLPKLLIETPPSPDHPLIKGASARLDKFLSNRYSIGDIDSLSFAVVTSDGPVFEKNFGVMRGNESNSPATTSHSMYRLASVSKLFTVFEGLLLEQKGALSWDDPVTKYLPDFKYRLDGFDPSQPTPPRSQAPITLFQLASHMSGLGRDWPPGTVSGWPFNLTGGGPPPTNGLPFPSHRALFEAIKKHHLTSLPYNYPAYSNTGTGLLGLALVAANRAAFGHKEPTTFADLLKRDIFDALGMNGSHFLTTETNKHLIVAPSLAPEVADQDFLDAMNPAGGQFSSLADLIVFTQTLLNSRHPRSLLTPYSLEKWLHTVHSFEEDDWTEIGFLWEIIKAQDSNGRFRKIYWKLGAMAGYHSAIAIHPGTSYGIVVLMGGHYADAAKLAYDAFEIFQPAIDSTLAELAEDLYGGVWSTRDGNSTASIVVDKGVLFLEEYRLVGVDALKTFHAAGRLALRSSGRRDEFRIDTGIPGYNGMKHMACYPYWNGQDLWGIRNNAAINLILFSGLGRERVLSVPSLDLTMTRTSK